MGDTFLQISEKTRLIQIVADLYEFLEPRNRRVFIQESAGLADFISGLDISGSARIVAGDLVGRLERFGQLLDRPAYHALGALLNAILGLGDLGNDKKKFVAELIVRYSLIADAAYLENLKHTYKITTVVRRPTQEAVTPKLGVSMFAKSPAFEAQITDEETLEAVINSEDNFLDIHLLNGALYCARAVGRIEVPEGTARGTGFLVAPDLLLTNYHVLKEKEHLEQGIVRFGYYKDASGVPEKGKVVKMRPDFYFTSPESELDYSLVRLQEMPLREAAPLENLATKPVAELARLGRHRGYLVLVPSKPIKLDRVNILQHPKGEPLKVVMTQNYVDLCTDTRLRYVADTMDGSSGSPVCNQKWEVVGLHHSGTPYPSDSLGGAVKQAWRGRFRVNEGILARAILQDFKNKNLDKYLPRY